jgi:nucleotide-binding universal stress UspA family protein
MYKRILVPTDGSSEALAAAQQAIELAKFVGASVVALHVAPPFRTQYFEDVVPPPDATREMWQAGLRNMAERHFQPLKQAAQEAGVPISVDVAFDERPAEAIVATAEQRACDLIVMGPRGRGRIADHLLGSVTAGVLGASKIPVLVHRSIGS